jgi:hypothetical protein
VLNRGFGCDGAENAIYVGLIHKTLGDNEGGKNVPAAQLEIAAVVDPSLIWPGAAPGDHGGRCPPGVQLPAVSHLHLGGLERWGLPRGHGAGRLLRCSTDSLAAFGRSCGSDRSFDLDRNPLAVQRSCLGCRPDARRAPFGMVAKALVYTANRQLPLLDAELAAG